MNAPRVHRIVSIERFHFYSHNLVEMQVQQVWLLDQIGTGFFLVCALHLRLC